jgi:hypothetical protein
VPTRAIDPEEALVRGVAAERIRVLRPDTGAGAGH